MTPLGPHGWAMLAFAVAVFVLFVRDRLPIATVCLGVLALLPLGFALFPLQVDGQTIDAARFFAGFGNPTLIAICGLMIVGQGLVVTGALEPVARLLSVWLGRRPALALLAVLVVAMAVSGVVNDTPVVVLMIPLLLAAARRSKTSPARMLMPMNYAVLIGGMATAIGTSTNLIVVGLATSLGLTPIGLFSFFPLVAVCAVPALAYLWLVAPRLLAHVKAPDAQLSEDLFDAELHIGAGSRFDGHELREALAALGSAHALVELRRGDVALLKLPTARLRAGDRLVVRHTAQRLKDLEAELGAALHDVRDKAHGTEPKVSVPALPHHAVVAQLLITPESPLAGRSVRQERLAERYELIVVGMRPRPRAPGRQRGSLADRPVLGGDILLIQGREDAIRQAQRDGIGLLLDDRFALPRQRQAPLALFTMAGVVVLAATQLMPIALSALCGALLLVVARCLSWQDIAQSLSTKVILLVAASLAIGDALQVSGATTWMAQGIALLAQDLPVLWVVAVLMGLMGLLTNFVSNNAAAAIGTPLAVSLAQALQAAPEPFVLAVLFGCNLCYLTPMGYQSNLLVMNAGGYRFGDFLRVGTPLFAIMWVGLTLALAWRYGL